MPIPAYRYDGDRLIPCENMGHRMLVRPPTPPPKFSPSVPTSRRERRWMARHGAGRRRMYARRVPPPRPFPMFARMPEPIALDGHRLQRALPARRGIVPSERVPVQEVLLYLPAGEPLTDRHLADAERALRGTPRALSQRERDERDYRIAKEAGDTEAAARVAERL